MSRLYPYLTFAGAIPFVFGAVCLSFGVDTLSVLGSVEKIIAVYALVITVFLTGAHWGQHLALKGTWSVALPISSNVIAVILWLGYLALDFPAFMTLSILTFLVLLFIDHKLWRDDLLTSAYLMTRLYVTVMVVISLGLAGLAA